MFFTGIMSRVIFFSPIRTFFWLLLLFQMLLLLHLKLNAIQTLQTTGNIPLTFA